MSQKRNYKGYSLIETMTVIVVIGIVLGLLYAYSDQGWNLFYQSYTRGLSQLKAKLAIRMIADDLREANKNRITIDHGVSYGVPLPDDTSNNSPYIYFTKPKFYEPTRDIIAYDYILYYFAKPKEPIDLKEKTIELERKRKKQKPKEEYLILKKIKFLAQSKFYTEDEEKTWPFIPPILELQKSTLEEDDSYLATLKQASQNTSGGEGELTQENITEEAPTSTKNKKKKEEDKLQFEDLYSKVKKASRNIPISGNFAANSLTEPFSEEQVNIFFGQDYRSDKPIKIKVSIQESPVLFGVKNAMTEFEVNITPRN